MNARRGIGCAGTARDEANARLSCQLAIDIRHHRRAAFLAADNCLNAAVDKGIQHRQIAFAGHTIEPVATIGFERIDNQLAAGFQIRHCRHPGLRLCEASFGSGPERFPRRRA